MRRLVLEPVVRGRRHLVLRYGVGDLRFSTTYWYDDVDFVELEDRYGADAMRTVAFHLLAFEANKAASLAPTEIDAGPYDDLVDDAFWHVWQTLFRHVWGVWRLENGLPEYRLPRPVGAPATRSTMPVDVPAGEPALLVLCGGGKDSLATMRLLERAGVDYDAFVYSHSTYGTGEAQHRLIDGLLAHCRPRRVHRAWILDDAVDAPVAAVYPECGVRRIVAAETVSSYLTALPVALQHGTTEVALGITRSTDEHNLVWDRTGEAINYLWGMSAAAEQLLHDHVRRRLASNVTMFHALRPIYDVNVFSMLRGDLDAVPTTHSCARQKPWCCRCAKCLYVWMSYSAWLPGETVAATVDVNMFDIPENRTILRKMLGLESYKPTDCVGTVSEARLAFAMCRARGIAGVIADDIDTTEFVAEAMSTLDRYAAVDAPGPAYPRRLVDPLGSLLRTASADTRAFALGVLGVLGERTDLTPATIVTERLTLSPLGPDDADELFVVLHDERMHEFTGGQPLALEELRSRYARLAVGRTADGTELWFNWIVRTIADATPVGVMQATVAADCSSADVAWEIGVPWQGRGFASEAAAAVVAWLAGHDVAIIEAAIHPDHAASQAVATRAGLRPTTDLVDGEVVWRHGKR